VGGGARITIDEVQREPALLRSIKRAIDQDRAVGRFLLTGSANLLLMRGVSESLAGRASYLTLWPMTRREQAGRAGPASGRNWWQLTMRCGANCSGTVADPGRTGGDWPGGAAFRRRHCISAPIGNVPSGSTDTSAPTSSAS
jgi:hypothetical protein